MYKTLASRKWEQLNSCVHNCFQTREQMEVQLIGGLFYCTRLLEELTTALKRFISCSREHHAERKKEGSQMDIVVLLLLTAVKTQEMKGSWLKTSKITSAPLLSSKLNFQLFLIQ